MPDIGFTVAGTAGDGLTVTVGRPSINGFTVGRPPGDPVSTARGKTPPTPGAVVGVSIVGFCILPNARAGGAIVGTSRLAA